VGARQFEAREGQAPIDAARAENDPVRFKPEAALGGDRVRVEEPRRAGLLVDGRSQSLDLLAQGRLRADLADDFAHPPSSRAKSSTGSPTAMP
jgi:hypothetical protein